MPAEAVEQCITNFNLVMTMYTVITALGLGQTFTFFLLILKMFEVTFVRI